MLNRAIFLDRDGVINKWEHPGEGAEAEKWYILSSDQFEFCDRALDAFRLIKEKLPDFKVIVVSNQSGIGKGLVDYSTIYHIFCDMRAVIMNSGGYVDECYICRHAPEVGCFCRKPRPGLFYYAAVAWDLDLSQSWMIGDSISDMGAANNADIPSEHRIYIRTSHNEPVTKYIAVHEAKDLYEAVEKIIELTEH